MDPKVGGTFRMSFTNFGTGQSHSFSGTYLDLVPHERIRYTDRFDDPCLWGEIQVTVTPKEGLAGDGVEHRAGSKVQAKGLKTHNEPNVAFMKFRCAGKTGKVV